MTYRIFILRRCLVFGFGVLLLVLTTFSAAAAGPKRVLILHSFGREFAPFTAISSAFRTELAQQSPQPIEVRETSLETALFVEGEREESVVEYLRVLLAGRPLDLVVTFGDPAGQFWLRHRQELLSSTPTLVAALDQRRLRGVTLGPDVAAVTFSLNLHAAIEHILAVLPGTTNIVAVIGNSPVEKYWQVEAKKEFQPFTNRVAFTWLNELPLGEMQKRVASLPAHSAILYGSVSLDADGVPYEQDRPLDTLHARANAPIFGFFDNLLGRGIVGGPLLPIQNVSRETARVAIRILEGESPAKIQTSPFEAATPAYDWRELKRWSINEKQLPPGSQVRFRVPTFWEQYRWRLIAIQVVVLAEAFIIFLLVRNRGRLRRAQRVLDERLRLEELVASVGAAFVNVAPDGMDEEIERWMQRMIP